MTLKTNNIYELTFYNRATSRYQVELYVIDVRSKGNVVCTPINNTLPIRYLTSDVQMSTMHHIGTKEDYPEFFL